ncbi:hypothetical protein RBB50_004342 [Rhinocladiella similis]
MNISWLSRVKRALAKHSQKGLSVYVLCCAIVVFTLALLSSQEPVTKQSDVVKRTFSTYQSTIDPGAFPRKIWQSWKVDPLDFEERDLNCARSWVTKNPGYRYEVLTDDNDFQYVETHFGPNGLNRPDIVSVYQSLGAKIVKADLLRYLVMYIEGGVYVDIDVEALKPIERFIPDRFAEQDIDMIIGVEVDQPQFANHPILGPKSRSFVQWTFACKPRLPVMLHLVEKIVKWLVDMSETQQVPISELSLNFDDVISGTGPSAFTEAIIADISQRERKDITWDAFHNMDEAHLIGGVLVLTVEAFAAGQGHSDSGTHSSRNALVKHHYHASGWPALHPRYKHPVYGEVEACNWDESCVRLWDWSKSVFEALPLEEQLKQIAERQEAENAALQPLQPLNPPEQIDALAGAQPHDVHEPAVLQARHLVGPSPDTSAHLQPTVPITHTLSKAIAVASPSVSASAVKASVSLPLKQASRFTVHGSILPTWTQATHVSSFATVYLKASVIPNTVTKASLVSNIPTMAPEALSRSHGGWTDWMQQG